MSYYPELEKIDEHENRTIMQFIDYLEDQGVFLGKKTKDPCNYLTLSSNQVSEEVIKFFGADPAKVELERRQLLYRIQGKAIEQETKAADTFNFRCFSQVVKAKIGNNSLRWASKQTGVSVATLSRVTNGHTLKVGTIATLLSWLCMSFEDFILTDLERGKVDLRTCKKGDILYTATSIVLEYISPTPIQGISNLDHVVRYVVDERGESMGKDNYGSRTHDGYVFKNNHNPEDHDVVKIFHLK